VEERQTRKNIVENTAVVPGIFNFFRTTTAGSLASLPPARNMMNVIARAEVRGLHAIYNYSRIFRPRAPEEPMELSLRLLAYTRHNVAWLLFFNSPVVRLMPLKKKPAVLVESHRHT